MVGHCHSFSEFPWIEVLRLTNLANRKHRKKRKQDSNPLTDALVLGNNRPSPIQHCCVRAWSCISCSGSRAYGSRGTGLGVRWTVYRIGEGSQARKVL